MTTYRPRQSVWRPGAAGMFVAFLATIVGAGVVPSRADDAALFEPLRRVMQHPRCQNCHAAGDAPRQGDQGQAHSPPVRRGADGKGQAALRCESCHTDRNIAVSPLGPRGVPGAPGWQMPPAETPMAFQGRPAGALCRALKDRAANGDRGVEQLGRHMVEDKLLAWAWAPGTGRTSPPLPKAEFDAAAIAWLRAGAPCPPD